jgi:hypothetical protein
VLDPDHGDRAGQPGGGPLARRAGSRRTPARCGSQRRRPRAGGGKRRGRRRQQCTGPRPDDGGTLWGSRSRARSLTSGDRRR